ncbi:retrovirus-related pol polyprotein from transposon TNT 1-94 [Tanacetum coccineum]
MKNKVEAQPRKVNKKNCVVEPIHDVDVKHSLLKVNSKLICATCKKSMFDGVNDMCLLDFVENVNSRAKSAKKHNKQNIWKPTGHVFTEVGLKITSANVVPPKKTTSHLVETQKPELKVYSRKPKNVKNVGSSKKAKIVESKNANHSEPNHTWGSNATYIPSSSSLVMIQIVLWYLDSGCSKHMTGNCSQLMNFVSKFLGTVRFGNDHIARIIGYDDYQLGKLTFQGVLQGVDLLSGSRDTNLYTISLDDMLKTSSICLLSKASKTKSWLWHRRLSHLNFGTLNKLAKDGLARGIPRLKFQKDHLTKDEAPEAIIKYIKNIQVRLNATVRNVRTYNGTEFVNQTLREFYENVGSRYQHLLHASFSRNDICQGETRTLVEAAYLGPELHSMTPATSSSGLDPNTISQQPCIPPNRDDLDYLFQPMFDEYCNPPSIAVILVQDDAAPRAVVLADSPVSTSIDQDTPSTNIPSTQEQ